MPAGSLAKNLLGLHADRDGSTLLASALEEIAMTCPAPPPALSPSVESVDEIPDAYVEILLAEFTWDEFVQSVEVSL
jgi:hypothetical protein